MIDTPPGMGAISTGVLLAVLGAALLHATWNAMVKSQTDPLVSMAWVSLASGVVAGLLLFTVAIPPAAAWPFLLISTVIHTAYNLLLATAYKQGDFSRIYPIARGSAPFLVTIASLVFLEESLSANALIAIGLILVAILGVAWRRASERAPNALTGVGDRSLIYAGLTAIAIAGYTIADGLGGRAAGDPIAYALWLFFIDAWPTIVIIMWLRRGAFWQTSGRDIRLSLAGGLLSMAAYSIVIWAMASAPVAVVAALRESSILFAALIGIFLLKEKPGPVRIAATLMLVAAIALLRLS